MKGRCMRLSSVRWAFAGLFVAFAPSAARAQDPAQAAPPSASPLKVTLDDSAPCRTNPLGAKGCGESGAIGGPPCIANGGMDALSDLGISGLNTPLTPMKIWQAIQNVRTKKAA